MGTGSKPIPLLEAEVEHILRHMGLAEPRTKEVFDIGECVKLLLVLFVILPV